MQAILKISIPGPFFRLVVKALPAAFVRLGRIHFPGGGKAIAFRQRPFQRPVKAIAVIRIAKGLVITGPFRRLQNGLLGLKNHQPAIFPFFAKALPCIGHHFNRQIFIARPDAKIGIRPGVFRKAKGRHLPLILPDAPAVAQGGIHPG